VTTAQGEPSATAAATDGVPARDRARGALLRLEPRGACSGFAGAMRGLRISGDGRFVAVETEISGCCGGPLAVLIGIADLDAPERAVVWTRGRLAGAGADTFFVLEDGLDLVEVDGLGVRRRLLSAGSARQPVARPGPGAQPPKALQMHAVMNTTGGRFALACTDDGFPPSTGVDVETVGGGTTASLPAGFAPRDWAMRDDGALLCAARTVRACGNAPQQNAVLFAAADGSVRRAELPASSCDYALDGVHALCADGQRATLLRLPDLAVARQAACSACWLRAIDPVLAIGYDGTADRISIWHVPTLTRLGDLAVDLGRSAPSCAGVDRHCRWLAIAAGWRVHVFAIVR